MAQPWELSAKRALDLAVSGSALVLCSPLGALIALAVYLDLGWPVLFRQRRPGRNGLPFELLKFRTMQHPSAARSTDAARLTTLGRLLRRLSADELPQLVNILRGEMSLVGPRPLLMEYLGRYSPRQAQRHAVRPGLTGLAQVSGRNALSWPEKFELDVRYVESWSFISDLRILAETVRQALAGHGVSAPSHATMPPFDPGGE